jgi:molybdate transport system ATP-binding protein
MALSDGHAERGAALRVQLRKRSAAPESSPFSINLDFTAPPGITVLFGASGAGKTTVLDCIAGLQQPESGVVAIGGSKLFDSALKQNLPPRRRGVGYLFQTLALFPHMTVQDNVEYGLSKLDPAEREERSREALRSFHIPELGHRRVHEISGGERQRVALARTLVTCPQVLLLDEPLTALDTVTKARIIDDLRAWNDRHQIPILYVTHDREEVFALAERVIALQAGRIVSEGSPHDVLHRPQLESVAQLAGFENVFECTVVVRHPDQGTMTCGIAGSSVMLEAPLTRIDKSLPLSVGIRAGDIMVAISHPHGLSARNVIAGSVRSLQERDVTVVAQVDCGSVFKVHLTPGAVRSLGLQVGSHVWLVIKTYSCHVLQ